MKTSFRLVSALLRHDWLIDLSYALAHEPLVNAYLSGQMGNVEESKPDFPRGFYLTTSTNALSGSVSNPVLRTDLEGSVPQNSVFVLDIRGPIMKEGSCFSYGTEEYAQTLREAYANPNVVGCVVLIDSPGGQLSGTPTLYDVIRDPVKPTGVVVNEGCMASAAYWLGCGADFIYASQLTDQIGSIGVFATLRDSSEALKMAGIKSWTVYSDRSPQKNKPMKEAVAGKPELLKEDLNQAADLFRAAVETGRGDRLKPALEDGDDVFEGGMFYASKAIALGLIDGFGDVNVAVAKIYELAEARKNSAASGPSASINLDSSAQHEAPLASVTEASTPAPAAEGYSTNPNSQTQQDDMFGDKHKKLSALAGVEASAITDEVLNEINANLDTLNVTGARVISTTYLQEAEQAASNLKAATDKNTALETQIKTLTEERDKAVKQAGEFGSQPGHLGSRSPKVDEPTAGAQDENEFFCETDAEAKRMRASVKK